MLFRLFLSAPPATRVLVLTFVAILAVTSVALAKGPYESEAENWTVSTYSPPDNLAMPRQNKNRWPRISCMSISARSATGTGAAESASANPRDRPAAQRIADCKFFRKHCTDDLYSPAGMTITRAVAPFV